MGDDLALFVELDVLRVLAGHLHIAAERQRADAVFGVATTEADNRRVETKLELQDTDAHAFRSEKMTQFVHEYQHAEHENECQNCDHAITSDLQF